MFLHLFVSATYEEISLFLTAAHELGHALGLYHSQAKNSIMSPYLFTSPSGTFTMPHDDVAGIQDLYGELALLDFRGG